MLTSTEDGASGGLGAVAPMTVLKPPSDLCFYFLVNVLCRIYNFSLETRIRLYNWKKALLQSG